MNAVINNFLLDRKTKWLKENTDKLLEAEQKFLLSNWLYDAAKRAKQLSISTHPGKFTHPDAKNSPIIAECLAKNDGFLRSGNVSVKQDAYGNAAALDVLSFLWLELNDGKTILQHLKAESETIKQIFNVDYPSFKQLQADFLEILKLSDQPQTHSKIKQVYFYIGDCQYHLLSIITPSGILHELKQRILEMRFSESVKTARESKKNNIYHENGFDELYNLITIGYGGSKPQNISALNQKSGGNYFLLPSLPPKLKNEQIILPKRDFFVSSLKRIEYKSFFYAIHKIAINSKNNMDVRAERNDIIQLAIEYVIEKMWQVRAQEPHWSKAKTYARLPEYQKIWLDQGRESEREINDDWLLQVIRRFARWFMDSYEKFLKEKAALLADKDMVHIFEKKIKDNKDDLL